MKKDSLLQKLLFVLAGALGGWLIGLYYLTVRIRTDAEVRRMLAGQVPAGIYPFWHSHQLSAVWHFRNRGIGIIISASRDGEYIARIAESLGFHTIRGSSSRGAVEALKEMIRFVKDGGALGITPDGPRGPRYSISPGALAAARATGRPIIPFAIGLSRFWEVRSWDRFRIPKPFSRGFLMLGEPMHVPADADEVALKALAGQLRDSMLRLEREADRRAGSPRRPPSTALRASGDTENENCETR